MSKRMGNVVSVPLSPTGETLTKKIPHTDRALDLFFTTEFGQPPPRTLATATAIDDTTITLSDATGMAAEQFFGIFGGDPDVPQFYFGSQVGAPSGSTITVDSPLDQVFDAGSVVVPLSRNLAVDGSTTPVTFAVQAAGATSSLVVNISRIIGALECDTAVDLNKFGNITGGLTKGLVLRRVNGVVENIWNIKKNAGFLALGYDWTPFSASNPSQAVDGMAFRYTFGGEDKHDTVIQLLPGDSLVLIVQDDLTELASQEDDRTFVVTAEGRFCGCGSVIGE